MSTVVTYPTCIIVSTLNDLHVQAVLHHLSPETIPIILDYSEYGLTYVASSSIADGTQVRARIDLNQGGTLSLDQVETIWWRRPQPFRDMAGLAENVRSYVGTECEHFWAGLWSSLPDRIRWYNHPDAIRMSNRKFHQLQIARSVGLATPRTLITSNPHEAAHFIRHHEKVIMKSFYGTPGAWEPTRLVTDDAVSKLHLLPFCPVIFQEYIDGLQDWRVTVIDDHVEAVSFDLSSSRYPMDVRIDTKTPAAIVPVHHDIQHKLFQFMRRYQIRYAAFDLRLGLNDTLYFLENNPSGQFLYLDQLANTNLAGAMGAALSTRMTIQKTDSVMENEYVGAGQPVDTTAATQPLALSLSHIEHLL